MNERLKEIVPVIYPFERPSAVKDTLDEFLVISIPSRIVNKEIGKDNDYNWHEAVVEVEIFVRDKKTSSNPNLARLERIDGIAEQIQNVFPIKDTKRKFSAVRPYILGIKSDGNGFHEAIIHADITTLI
ncbi:MAG: hypothetical protein K5854_01580 [Prevotella sp.]|nr:hypothetical protein [Prevotella sp.]